MKRLFRPLDRDEAARVRPWRPPALAPVATTAPGDGRAANGDEPPIDAALADASDPSAATGPVTVEPRRPAPASASASDGASDAGDGGRETPEPDDAEPAVASGEAFDAGFDAGARTAREAMADDVARLLRSVAEEHERWRRDAEHDTVALARALARWTLRRELREDPDTLARLVREAIDAIDANAGPDATGSQPLEVALHPLDLATLPALGSRVGSLALVGDDALSRGDCRIVGATSSVDARVIDWIDAAARATDAPSDAAGETASPAS